jgi:regulation of enolase protein 1 (concanavalin A-like superfamily)
MRNALSSLALTGAISLMQAATLQAAEPAAGEMIFKDDFNGKLGEGWSFEREERAMWRVGPSGLEVRVQPGNMWGGANNAKNVLVHSIPVPTDAPIEISATISNNPTAQWEQANLVWYYDGGNMVKLGQELVTGRYSIVMGREENDRARTVAIIPLDANAVELRLQAVNNRVRGQFRTAPWSNWRDVGECDLPVKGEPKASLHFYNGPPNEEHWVRVNNFTVRRLPAASVDWPRVRVAESMFRSAGPFGETSLATLSLPGNFAPGDFTLYNKADALRAVPKAEFEQRVFVHQDGSYGWSWDRRGSGSKEPITCGVAMGYYTGRTRIDPVALPSSSELKTVGRRSRQPQSGGRTPALR